MKYQDYQGVEREVKIVTGRPGRPKGVTIIGGKDAPGVQIISANSPVEKEEKDAPESGGESDAKDA